MHSVYKIVNFTLEKFYVGKTVRNPFTRLRGHMSALGKGTHHNVALQEAFTGSHISEWGFVVLETNIESLRECNELEGRIIATTPLSELFNDPKSSPNSQIHQYYAIAERLWRGQRFIDIRDELGVSLGTISRVRELSGNSSNEIC